MTSTLLRPPRFHGDLLVGGEQQAQLLLAFPPTPCVLRRRRQRTRHCWSAANELAMQHLDIADKVAANLSRRTGHPIEDLRQIAMMGIIEASRRNADLSGPMPAPTPMGRCIIS